LNVISPSPVGLTPPEPDVDGRTNTPVPGTV
jgi:hypothetical protein